ncbi:hypothetical protein ACGFXC_36290 [Streptomyces sp. NPDC048507]|uniref:hypothetical protein n=1 Tax=Streptomyces sp. NPDC048507 TaxID=3365560 RepID=UPI003717614D
MSDSVRQPVKPEVTLFSGVGHTGDSCVLPMDGLTYSLKATGLAKIASVRVDWPAHEWAKPVVRLYCEVPTGREDFAAGNGAVFRDFVADSANTGKWAYARWIKGYADDGMERTRSRVVGPCGGRLIHDRLARPDDMSELSHPAVGGNLFG